MGAHACADDGLLSKTASVQAASQLYSVVVKRRVVAARRVEAPDIAREVSAVRAREIMVDVLCAVNMVEGGGGRNIGEAIVVESFRRAPWKADIGDDTWLVSLGLHSSNASTRVVGLIFMVLELGPAGAVNNMDGFILEVLMSDLSRAAIKARASIVALLEVEDDGDVVVANVVATLTGSPTKLILDVGVEVLVIAATVIGISSTSKALGAIGPVSMEVIKAETSDALDFGAMPSSTFAHVIMSVAKL